MFILLNKNPRKALIVTNKPDKTKKVFLSKSPEHLIVEFNFSFACCIAKSIISLLMFSQFILSLMHTSYRNFFKHCNPTILNHNKSNSYFIQY